MDSKYTGGCIDRRYTLEERSRILAQEAQDSAIRKLFEQRYIEIYKNKHFSDLYDQLGEELSDLKYQKKFFGVMITINFDPMSLSGMSVTQIKTFSQDVMNKLSCKKWLKAESACLENYSIKKRNFTHYHIHAVGMLETRYSPMEIGRFLKRDCFIGNYVKNESAIDVRKFAIRDLTKMKAYTRKSAWQEPGDHELERVCHQLEINGVNVNKSKRRKVTPFDR